MSNAELIERLEKKVNTEAFARAIYKKQSDYYGADHEGYCVEQLRVMLASYEKDMQLAAQALREADIETKDLKHVINDLYDLAVIKKLQARINALEGALREIALDSTNPTNQRSYAAERAEQALQDKD